LEKHSGGRQAPQALQALRMIEILEPAGTEESHVVQELLMGGRWRRG
jgi:hypothetical protein